MVVTVSIITGFHDISASLFHIVLLLTNAQCTQCMRAGNVVLLRRKDGWKEWRDLKMQVITEI